MRPERIIETCGDGNEVAGGKGLAANGASCDNTSSCCDEKHPAGNLTCADNMGRENLSSGISCDKKLGYFDFVSEDDNVYAWCDQLILSHLEGAPKENILTALREFSDVFLKKDQKLGCTDKISHCIETDNAISIYVRTYCVLQTQNETLKQQKQSMLDAEVIVPSASHGVAQEETDVNEEIAQMVVAEPERPEPRFEQEPYQLSTHILNKLEVPFDFSETPEKTHREINLKLAEKIAKEAIQVDFNLQSNSLQEILHIIHSIGHSDVSDLFAMPRHKVVSPNRENERAGYTIKIQNHCILGQKRVRYNDQMGFSYKDPTVPGPLLQSSRRGNVFPGVSSSNDPNSRRRPGSHCCSP
ncbi:hypothetical protein PR048_012527 [Dryococelus australis]|uniref:Uncharacterized protein n=1 Tax=Dryococelus australis TaxID=614101 RepID=A0ABQ9HPT2_9NEOP|nr:hypothetical protein PR048_012527 [Dryococelus australis]